MDIVTPYVSVKHKSVILPATEQLTKFFTTAPVIVLQGEKKIVVPHAPRETFMLEKFGYSVPAPILTNYNWPHPIGQPPFEAQKQTAVLMSTHDRAYVLNQFGTGKTRSALWAWDYLHKEGLAGKLLVLAPLSTLYFTWSREVFDTLPHRKCEVLYGPKAKRLERLAKDVDIYICNHDGIKVLIEEFEARKDIDTLVIDELAVFRNPSAIKVKLLRKYVPQLKLVYGLTGAPIPTSPTDVWAQAKIVTPDRVTKYFKGFRDSLLLQVAPFRWIPKPDAVQKAFAALQPSVRFTLDDVVELPEIITRMQDVPLGKTQQEVYDEMAKRCYVALKNGEITAANAGAVLVKLLQVACGWVYTKDGTTIELDADKRVELLLQQVTSNDQKVLVFAPYKHVLNGIQKALTKEGVDHAVVSGETNMKERTEIFTAFQNSSKYHVIAAHPQTMAHGLTLTKANTIIWFSPITSLEIFEQANARIRRSSQKHKQLILCLQGAPVERRMYQLLWAKAKLQNELLSLFEEMQ